MDRQSHGAGTLQALCRDRNDGDDRNWLLARLFSIQDRVRGRLLLCPPGVLAHHQIGAMAWRFCDLARHHHQLVGAFFY